MKLKHVAFTILTSIILGTTLFSCDSKDETLAPPLPYKNVQIHSFSIHFLQSLAQNRTDSIIYKQLEDKYEVEDPSSRKKKGYSDFVIDQRRGLIFNDDSLPYQTRLTTFPIDLGFGPHVSPGVTVTTSDSTFQWEKRWKDRDSLDLAKTTNLTIISTDGNAKITKQYTLDIRVHQVDPDTIIWKALPSLKSIAKEQTTVLWTDKFINYQLKSDNKVYVSEFTTSSENWGASKLTNLPSNLDIRSITSFDDKVFAVSKDGFGYISSDAITWTKGNNFNLNGIYGIIPASVSEKNILLVSFKKEDKFHFATTKDMLTFEEVSVDGNSEINKSLVPYNFISKGFAQTLVEQGANKQLSLTGGTDVLGRKTNSTWSLRLKNDNVLQVTTTTEANHKIFDPQDGLAGMYYDQKLYVLNDSVFTISNNMGGKWRTAPIKQSLPKEMKGEKWQNIYVDNKNYIWVFSGMPNAETKVWRGRLNKLNPKK